MSTVVSSNYEESPQKLNCVHHEEQSCAQLQAELSLRTRGSPPPGSSDRLATTGPTHFPVGIWSKLRLSSLRESLLSASCLAPSREDLQLSKHSSLEEEGPPRPVAHGVPAERLANPRRGIPTSSPVGSVDAPSAPARGGPLAWCLAPLRGDSRAVDFLARERSPPPRLVAHGCPLRISCVHSR
ncbi:hypothetical protein CAAN3_03S08548 [[Candida] anglica]